MMKTFLLILSILFIGRTCFSEAGSLRSSHLSELGNDVTVPDTNEASNRKDRRRVEDDEPAPTGPPPEKVAPAAVSGTKRTIANLQTNFQLAKARMLQRLRAEYGDYVYDNIWMDTPVYPTPLNATRCTMGRNAFLKGTANSQKNWAQTVRKMKINLLQYLIEGKVQDYVWVTAGNMDAAGHGNFFDQQYTMVMKDRASDIFTSVGLDLVARPFGIGHATSAPEVAGCAKEIFGADADLVTWDFAMTDGRWHWRLEMFAHRISMLPNHPTLLVIQAGTEPIREQTVRFVAGKGCTALRQDEKYVVDRQLKVPDSRFKSFDELQVMPPAVRYFRCGYGIESGEDCQENKFTQNGTCDGRPHMTNWHRGWKWHAFQGNMYALFLMEVLDDAILELQAEAEGDLIAILERLEAEEYSAYNFFLSTAELKFADMWSIDSMSAFQLYRDPTYCHTALLPAQTRYLGYVSEEERYDDWFKHYKGFPLDKAMKFPRLDMHLAYEPLRRENKCEIPLSIDSKDFFLAADTYKDSQRVIIPNDAEVRAYGQYSTAGIIMVCAQACSFECAGSPLLNPDAANKGRAEFRVNGEDVASVLKFDNCYLLQREDGELHWPPNSAQRYEIEARSLIPGKQFRFSSFIVW